MSRFSFVLRLSGFTGLSVGFLAQFYIVLLRDPVLYGGAQSIPGWMSRAAMALLVGSLAVLFYSDVLDEVFKGWTDLVTLCALGGQWGVPLGLFLTTATASGSPVGLLTVVGYGLHALVALVVAINHLRRR